MRGVAILLSILIPLASCGMDAFSQEVDRVAEPFPVTAGEHELSVKLASRPGAFITVELSFLPEDTEPPEISIVPENGVLVSTDMPLLRVEYSDDITGVDPESLSILLNGSDVTERFQVDEAEAEWQLTIDSYLEEGPNEISVRLFDRIGNEANEISIFTVQTPTVILKADLTHEDSRYRRRSAYKLLFRPQEISTGVQRRCLKQLYETPEPRAFKRFVEILNSSKDHLSRALTSAWRFGNVSRASRSTWAALPTTGECHEKSAIEVYYLPGLRRSASRPAVRHPRLRPRRGTEEPAFEQPG